MLTSEATPSAKGLGFVDPSIALDGPAKEVDLFVPANVDCEVHETALDLRPLVARLSRQPVGVLLERLVEDADDDQSSCAA